MKKSISKGDDSFSRSARKGGVRLDPILGYCSDIISHLNKEDTSRLTENLLEILNKLRPHLNAGKKTSPLVVELLDWDAIKIRNLKTVATKSPAKLSHQRR